MPHFYDCFNITYQFIKFFLDNKMSILERYGAFKMLEDLLHVIDLYGSPSELNVSSLQPTLSVV